MLCGDLAAGRAPGRGRIVGQRPDPAGTRSPPHRTRAAATVLVMAEQDAVYDVTYAAGAALLRRTKQRRGQPSKMPADSRMAPYQRASAVIAAMHHGTASAAPRTMLSFPDSRFPIPDSRFPIPAMRASPHILSRRSRVIGCRHSVKECVRLSSLYFRSPPQLPQELHEHRTACRNRPGDGRPG